MTELILFVCVATYLINLAMVAGLMGKDWHPAVTRGIDKLFRITISPLIFLPAFFSWAYMVTVGGEAYREAMRDYIRYMDEKEGGANE